MFRFRPLMLEAIFVAGSVLVGMMHGSGAAWRRTAAVARAEVNIGYQLVSGRAACNWYAVLAERLKSSEWR